MEEKTMDRRQRKTREAIKRALIELLAEKDISKITTKDIAEHADINRSTFYLHYLDAYSVLESIQEDAASTVISLADMPIDDLKANMTYMLTSVTELLDANVGFVKFLMRNKTGFYARIESALTDRFTRRYIAAHPDCDELYVNSAMSFIMSGLFGTYSRWLETRPCSIERLCECISSVIENGIVI